MRFFTGNTCYLFTIAKGGNNDCDSTEGFHVEFQYRRSQESSPEALGMQEKRILHFPNDQQFGQLAELLISNVLQEHQVPANIISDMSVHFKFHLFGSRLYRTGGSYNVVVCLEVKEYTAERAALIQRRIESSRRVRGGGRREVVERVVVAAFWPADKEVVEKMEREAVEVVKGDDECSICLGKIGVGDEVMKFTLYARLP